MSVLEQWDFKGMIEGLRAAADSPRDQVAITRYRLVEAADAIEELLACVEKAWEEGYYAARQDWINGRDEATPNPFIEGGDD